MVKVVEGKKHYMEEIKNLEVGGEVKVVHPTLKGITITVRMASEVHYVLGQATRMYKDTYEVEDNSGYRIEDRHSVELPYQETVDYIGELMESGTKRQFVYVRNLREKGLGVGDVIEIERDNKVFLAVICETDTDYPNLKYRVITKKGVPSKGSMRMLYGSDTFKKVGVYVEGEVIKQT